MTTLREAGEAEVVRRLAALRPGGPGSAGQSPACGPAMAGVIVGSGDDAAVLRIAPGRDLVATTDAFVEGRHYDPTLLSPRQIGARLAAANASDLAAMAAAPRWALLSMGARPDRDLEALVAIQDGLATRLAADGATIVGGNVVAVVGAEWMSLTLLGEVRTGNAWTRAGARAGDLVAVTGAPGRAGAAYRLWRRDGVHARAAHAALFDVWVEPASRVAFALALAETGAVTAAVDVSDGLAGDLARLCEASRVGAEIDPRAWPDDRPLADAAQALGIPAEDLRFGASDDYELALAVSPARRDAAIAAADAHGVAIAFIGRFTPNAGVRTRRGEGEPARAIVTRGFDHFA